jgi:hypothetical protein
MTTSNEENTQDSDMAPEQLDAYIESLFPAIAQAKQAVLDLEAMELEHPWVNEDGHQISDKEFQALPNKQRLGYSHKEMRAYDPARSALLESFAAIKMPYRWTDPHPDWRRRQYVRIPAKRPDTEEWNAMTEGEQQELIEKLSKAKAKIISEEEYLALSSKAKLSWALIDHGKHKPRPWAPPTLSKTWWRVRKTYLLAVGDPMVLADFAVLVAQGPVPEFESVIAQSAAATVRYATEATKERLLAGEALVGLDPYLAARYAAKLGFGWIDEDILDRIASDAQAAMLYACQVLRSDWPIGEPAISTDGYASLKYSLNGSKQRFKLGERAMSIRNMRHHRDAYRDHLLRIGAPTSDFDRYCDEADEHAFGDDRGAVEGE